MHIRRRIELYLRHNDMPPTRFGREAIGDPRLVQDLKNGRELREKTRARLAAWLDRHEELRR
jgi:2,4-dienoyl-CoA reductase-like NADH-dependent reductase (Old Yellow Enzyme family)